MCSWKMLFAFTMDGWVGELVALSITLSSHFLSLHYPQVNCSSQGFKKAQQSEKLTH